MRIRMFLMATVLATSAYGVETPMPEFADPNIACAALKGDFYINDCLKKAQSGYDTAKALWLRISEETARHCSMVAKGVALTYRYSILGECVAQYYYGRDKPNEKAPPFAR